MHHQESSQINFVNSVTIREKQQQQHRRRNQKLACGITHAISVVKDID